MPTSITTPTPSTPGSTPSPIAPADLIFVTVPPPDVHIPSPPAGFVPVANTLLRGSLPRKVELVAVPAAVTELQAFVDYVPTFGKTAPDQLQVFQLLNAANQWTSLRKAAAAWDAYCASQEAIAWKGVRVQLARLAPSFDLAAQGDPTLAAKYPNLDTLLHAKKAIAKKGGSTVRNNNRARAAGKPAHHGLVGKKRQRALEKAAAIAAAAAASGHATSPAPEATPSSPVSPTPMTTGTASHG